MKVREILCKMADPKAGGNGRSKKSQRTWKSGESLHSQRAAALHTKTGRNPEHSKGAQLGELRETEPETSLESLARGRKTPWACLQKGSHRNHCGRGEPRQQGSRQNCRTRPGQYLQSPLWFLFWGYLLGSLIQNWLNQKRNYNGDYR